MKATELMIGDWVCYSKANKYYTRVNEIRHTEVPLDDQWYIEGMRSNNDKINPNAVEYFAVEILSPIPLTDEILEKNEFYYENNIGHVLEHYNYEIIYDTWEHELRILKDREQILKIKTFDKMCVHELQHALRLCGINKEIEL